MTDSALKVVYMGNIIKVDYRAELIGKNEILDRSIIGGKHYIVTRNTAALTEHKLGKRRAVHAASFLMQNAHNFRIGSRLYSEVFLESFVPRKRLVKLSRVLPYSLFVIEVVRCGKLFRKLFELLKRYKRLFHMAFSFSNNIHTHFCVCF